MTKLERCKELLGCWEQPDYRYRQILHAVFQNRVSRFQDMTVLSGELREKLRRELGETVLTLRPVRESRSGQADKLLFELEDGSRIETVRLHYQKGWESFCISSQCGCAFGCKFCATGTMKKLRNLTAWEIIEQLLYFHLQGRRLDSVSFMGMGEPLANPHILQALSLLTDPALFGLSQRRITVSTVGVAPGLKRLTAEFPQVNLAYSLHAPTPELRKKLMPVEKRWSMEQVLPLLNTHILRTHRRVFLAYILLRQINDSPAHAKKLAQLLRRNLRALPLYHVDLIPYNETAHSGGIFAPPEQERIQEFLRILRQAGIRCSARTQFGSDISAACGQLCAEEAHNDP
ncbi:MAG: 23S rRNA (adenine(2503)-C(8))-methyltransferase Cfr [Acutalibacter sp.]|nr:23S rRNA (adenine(2503)-C(8))-methyltransferase Cfr [Acutalibacter sp.]